jgi:hypothetical protein
MANKLHKLELMRVFNSDANEMIQARERAITVHRTSDIDAAGDEVEEAVRRVLRRKLPTTYYTGQGHIVDAALSVSPQLDIIIANNSAAPILFRSENGTEYFPFESVYAFGEIKSTYYNSKGYIEHFVANIRAIRKELNRNPTPPTYIGGGIELSPPLTLSEKRPFRNPLFAFMLFVNGGDFHHSDLRELYGNTKIVELPNLICILDRGIVVNVQVLRDEKGQQAMGNLHIAPEISISALGGKGRWAFIPFGEGLPQPGSNLAVLWFTLLAHLQATTLMTPNLIQYVNGLLSHGEGVLLA